jgi:ubiquinone/menaquinone biosynthesis C-methylase UbiE
MLSIEHVLLLLLAGFVIVFAGWRLASSRVSLPCPPWLAFLVELDNPLFRNNRASAIIAGLELGPGMRALDAGCGPGRLTIPLAQWVGAEGRVVAVDLQPEMLARAKTKAERMRLRNIEFRQARLGAGELQFEPFDRAVMVTVLGEIPDQAAALREMLTVLKPGGVLAVSEVIADPHFQRRSHMLALAAKAGFREKARKGGRLAYTLYLERPN